MVNIMQAALIESRTLRDSLAQQTKAAKILEKVKALTLLPDDVHATIEMTAEFYETHEDAIEWVIRNHRDELESDGLTVLDGERLSAFKAETGFSSRAASLTLIPRRALLRIGMLLRDSEVAKQVRTALLDTEAEARQFTWVKVAREVDAVARMHRLSGKSKQEAFRLAVLRVQEQTSTDLTEFLPPEPNPEERSELDRIIDNLIAYAKGTTIRPLSSQPALPEPSGGWHGFWKNENTVMLYPEYLPRDLAVTLTLDTKRELVQAETLIVQKTNGHTCVIFDPCTSTRRRAYVVRVRKS